MKNSFIIYQDQKEIFESLSDSECKELILAIFNYQSLDVKQLSTTVRIAFITFKNQLLRDEIKWEETREKRIYAGRMGGIKRQANLKQMLASASKTKQRVANQAVNVNVNVNVESIYKAFKEKINKESRLTPLASEKINQRLKTFTLEEILKAINNFSADEWNMTNNAFRGIAWFFHTDDRIDGFMSLNLRGGKKESDVIILNKK